MATYGTYSLEVLRGLSGNRDLLSCAQDASIVDLYNEVGKEGRQQWYFDSTDEVNWYRIRVSGGMDDPALVYLTGAGQQGVIMAAYSEAIHQYWKIIDFDVATNQVCLKNRLCDASDYEYLSCTSDGLLVDRFSNDDGSGRQRWQMQGPPIPPH